ncbi:MAG: SAM-dependent methyltransferase [Thermoplasmata archaeon]|nr:SAM-dependent methyltransferase [Thermoplasmata archaeon]
MKAAESPSAVPVPPWLARALARRSGGSGFLAFDLVIDAALYSSEGGYYATLPSPLGPSGDFYTAPNVDSIFGATVARRILTEFDRLGRPAGFTVAELGPGDGTLARDVALALDQLGARHQWEYVLVDRPSVARDAAEERLRGAASPDVFKIGTSPSLGELGPFYGIVIGNELLDALPFRRFRRRAGVWEELGVRFGGDAVEPAASTTFRTVPGPGLPHEAEEGAIVEVNTLAEALVREVGDHLARGSAIFLDYGDDEAALLRTRPRGTWTAFVDHRVVDDPLAHLGGADLSVFVNFTRLRAAASRAGLRETAFRPQRAALADWGIEAARASALDRATSDEERVRLQLATKKLLFGFEHFWAWELTAPGAG